jgi:hypothetical protein
MLLSSEKIVPGFIKRDFSQNKLIEEQYKILNNYPV